MALPELLAKTQDAAWNGSTAPALLIEAVDSAWRAEHLQPAGQILAAPPR